MDKNQLIFSSYFNNWLYGKNGYYANYKSIGKGGDFYTAVSTSKFFGGSIGKRVVNVIEEGFLPIDTTIVEIGAHHGYLLSDMIEFIYTLNPKLIKTLKFAIVERYEHLKIKQKEYFKQCFGDEIELIHYDDIKELKLDDSFDFQDIKSNQITTEQIEQMRKMTGSYESLFSERAMKFKSMGLKNKSLSENDYKKLIVEEYTFLKRPVIIINEKRLIN